MTRETKQTTQTGTKRRIVYFLPHVFKSSGGIYVLLKQAKILQNHGYQVCLYYQPRKHEKMEIYYKIGLDWVDFDVGTLQIKPLHPQNAVFSDNTLHLANQMEVGKDDIFVIPEGFPNIMKLMKNHPCKKIVFAQGASYIWRTLALNESWSDFGIKDAITISQEITKNINLTMPKIKTYNYYYSINRSLFHLPNPKLDSKRDPLIVYMINRGQPQEMAANSIIKIFRLAYPKWSHYQFERLQGLSRTEFAKKLQKARFALQLDDYVGLPTFPLEAMACGTHPIGWPGIGGQEHVQERSGHWSPQHSLIGTAEILNQAIEDYENDKLDYRNEVYEKILSRFTDEEEEKNVVEIYEKLC